MNADGWNDPSYWVPLLVYRVLHYLRPFVIALVLLVVQESVARRRQLNVVFNLGSLILTWALSLAVIPLEGKKQAEIRKFH